MNKADITDSLLKELNRLGVAVLASTPSRVSRVQLVSASGPSGALFFKTAGGSVLTSTEIHDISFEEVRS